MDEQFGKWRAVRDDQWRELPNKILGVEVEDEDNDFELLFLRARDKRRGMFIRESTPYSHEPIFAELMQSPLEVEVIMWTFHPAPPYPEHEV